MYKIITINDKFGFRRMAESLIECPYWICGYTKDTRFPHICRFCTFVMNVGMSNRLNDNCSWLRSFHCQSKESQDPYLLRWLISLNCGKEALEKYNQIYDFYGNKRKLEGEI